MPKLETDKIQDLIRQVKEHSDHFVEKGANKEALQAHVAKLESEMKKPAPDQGVLAETLGEIETAVGEAEESMMSKGILQLLNQIFGTGVPNP